MGWSDLFTFHTIPSGVDWSPTVLVYGDMGNSNAQALASLQEAAQKNTIHSILHIGIQYVTYEKYYNSPVSNRCIILFIQKMFLFCLDEQLLFS